MLDDDLDPDAWTWAEDRCEVCGAWVGAGLRLFHLGRCDAHPRPEPRPEPRQCHRCGCDLRQCCCHGDAA